MDVTNQIVINYMLQETTGKEYERTYSYINPKASNAQIKQFAQIICQIQNSTYLGVTRVSKYNIKTQMSFPFSLDGVTDNKIAWASFDTTPYQSYTFTMNTRDVRAPIVYKNTLPLAAFIVRDTSAEKFRLILIKNSDYVTASANFIDTVDNENIGTDGELVLKLVESPTATEKAITLTLTT